MRWVYIVALIVVFILFILGKFVITAFQQYFEDHPAEILAHGFRWALCAIFCWIGVLFLDSNDSIGAIVSIALGAGCVIWAIYVIKARKE